MRTRKAWAVVLLLTVVIVGGGVVGLTVSPSPSMGPSVQYGASRPLGSSQVTAAGSAASPFSPGPLFSHLVPGASTSTRVQTTTVVTTVAGAATTVVMS